jgi:enoyl-CoA hydratase
MAPVRPASVDVIPDAAGPGVTRVLLDRPPANAFDLGFYQELLEVVCAIAGSPPRCVELGSKVRGFFSGGRDLKEPSPATTEQLSERQSVVTSLYDTLQHLPCVTIAVIEGYALGTGCVIASLCDIRLATSDAVFGLPEIRAGSVGGARHLMRVLPHSIVRRMALTAEPITAQQACAHGFVDLVAPNVPVWSEADRLAQAINGLDSDMVVRVKRALDDSEELPLREGFAVELAMRRDRPDATTR